MNAQFDDGIVPDSFHVDPKTGAVHFSSNGRVVSPNDCSIDFGYSRPRKEKVLRKYPVPPSNIQLHPDYAVYDLDTVYVVDTNTRNNISVTCVVRGKLVFGENGIKNGIRFRTCPYIVFKGRQPSPERAAWREVLRREFSKEDGDTGLIVDADLGKHSEFNSRTEPIVDDFYLPERVQLIYASADSGKEHFTNQIMSKVDKAATRMLRRIESGEVALQ